MSGCHGACCAAFCVSNDESEGIAGAVAPAGDGEVLEDMLIEISKGEALLRLTAFDGHAAAGVNLDSGRPWFKCRHWGRDDAAVPEL